MTSGRTSVRSIAQFAKKTSQKLANLDTESKNDLLRMISQRISQNKEQIAQANLLDVQAAKKMVEEGTLTKPLLNRLILSEDKIDHLGTYLEEVAKLDDPIGRKQYAMKLSDGLELERISCPIGVIAIIFESRPEVVIQVSALSIKSGNVAILKGGREAGNSNRILFQIISEVLDDYNLNGSINLIETREDVFELLKEHDNIDLIIPRGSNSFVRFIQENTKIPVLGHSSGICHLYLDQNCDPQMGISVTIDAKTDYPSACNAVETLLVHRNISEAILPELLHKLKMLNTKLKGCEKTLSLSKKHHINIEPALEADWRSEYTDLILAVKIVDSLDEAIDHINLYGSHHTDSIITNDQAAAELFLSQVDSGCVFHNVSTRFSDGHVFGLGAEVGISTNKTHARGPVGLEGMVIYKYLLRGNGQLRATFSGKEAMPFLHIPLPLD